MTTQPYQASFLIIYACLSSLLVAAGLAVVVYFNKVNLGFNHIAFFWSIIWLVLAILFTLLSLKQFVIGYLCSTMCIMIAWRIAVIGHLNILSYVLPVSFILIIANFVYCCWVNLHLTAGSIGKHQVVEWQVLFVRMYIGFDFIPHFTEKLFAGTTIHAGVVQDFIHLGLPHPNLFVWAAGFCEFISTISIGLGLFIRPGAIFCTIYLLIATYLGHHFSTGFMWIRPGGGWEFAVLWAMLIFSFAFSGDNFFSIDEYIKNHFSLRKRS